MRQGQIDSLKTVIIVILAIIMLMFVVHMMDIVGIHRSIKTLAEASSVNTELTLQNRQLINRLTELNQAQNEIIVGGRK